MSDDSAPKTLAEQLAGLDIKIGERVDLEEESEGGAAGKKGAEERPKKPPPEPREVAAEKDSRSPEEMFLEAVQNIDRAQVFRGKYGLPDDDWTPGASSNTAQPAESGSGEDDGSFTQAMHEEREDARRGRIKELQDRRFMTDYLGDMDAVFDSEKYREKQRKEVRPADEVEFTTPSLPTDGDGLREVKLEQSQRKLLKDFERFSRSNRVPEINLRGDRRDEAIDRVNTFLPNCFRRGDAYVRIICGRGKNSAEDPVIKPAVIEWIEGPGATMVKGYAPQVQRGGDYGSIILELRQPSKS